MTTTTTETLRAAYSAAKIAHENAARSAYRAEVRFSITPFRATPEKLASMRQLYDDLCALDIGDRPIIDAAAWIEAATGGDDAEA